MSAHFSRAQVLLSQGRYEQAEQEFRAQLAQWPNDGHAHALLALCLSEQEKYAEAEKEARAAVHLAPDEPFSHYALAIVLHQRERLDEAELAVREAIRLDPEDADYFAHLAAICANRTHWKEALAAAEQGLQLDAEHVQCANMRAMSLVKLGRREEAGQTMQAALRRDPENEITHANLGWTALETGDPKKAMEHFREALRIDPNCEWARQGIVQALRARHLIYRVILAYFFWMSRLSAGARWGVIIGAVVAVKILRSVEEANPNLSIIVLPLVILYFVFVALTWLAQPLFDLLLRLNRFGRLALSDQQRRASNWVGCLLLVGLIFLGLWPLTDWLISDGGADGAVEDKLGIIFLLPALYFLALMAPVSATFLAGKRVRPKLLVYTIVLAALGPLALMALFIAPSLAGALAWAFLLGWVGFSWFVNFLTIRR